MGTYQIMKDKVDNVAQHSSQRRREIEDFITVITKRIESEEYYSKGLEEIAKLANKIRQGEESASSLAYSTFKFDCNNRSAQARIFSKSLKQQVLCPLKQLLVIQNQQTKQLQKSYKKVSKQLQQLEYQTTKINNKFNEEYQDRLETLIDNEILLQSMKTMKDKRIKAISKTTDIVQTLTEIQKKYQKTAFDYNVFLHRYYEQIQSILGMYQKHQEDRISIQEEIIMKTLVFESSMMKNFEYDIATITKEVQNSKQINDIEAFINKTSSKSQKLTEKNLFISRDLMGWTMYHIGNKDFEKKIRLQLNKQLKTYIQKAFKGQWLPCDLFDEVVLQTFKSIFGIVSQLWKGQPLEASQSQLLKLFMKQQMNRFVLFLYIQQYLLVRNVVLSQNGFKQITTLFVNILDYCLQYNDVFVARKITNLSFTYHVNRDDHKNFIHYNLNDSKIYEYLDYWKASVFESVQQELYLNYGNNIEQQIEMRETSMIVGQLALYCNQMILLGVSNKNVRQMIGQFCHLYNIPQDRNRDLSRTVTSSHKKYLQLFALTDTTKSQSDMTRQRSSTDEIPNSNQQRQEINTQTAFLKQTKQAQ